MHYTKVTAIGGKFRQFYIETHLEHVQKYGILDPSYVKDKNGTHGEKNAPPHRRRTHKKIITYSYITKHPKSTFLLIYLNDSTFGFERFLLTVELFRFWLKPKNEHQ